MQFSRLYNEKSFDSQHDIVVSLKFAAFNPQGNCSGGICIAFYEDSLTSPFGGGIEGSLGYTPYTETGSLSSAFEGLQGGHFGVALDISGEFSKEGNGKIDGDYKANPNTIAFRGSQMYGYPFLGVTEDLSNMGINLGQDFTTENLVEYTTLRFVLTEHGRLLKVEKMISPDNFELIKQVYYEDRKKTAYRVVCNIVSPSDDTIFRIKEFNCYGFEKNVDKELNKKLESCLQFISYPVFESGTSNKLFLGSNNFVAENFDNLSFKNYVITSDLVANYDYRQTINYNSQEVFLDYDYNSDFLITRNLNLNTINIYRNLGRNVVYEYSVISNSVSGFGYNASIDGDYLFVSTVSSVEIYQRNNYNWNFASRLNDLSGIPANIKFYQDNGIIAYSDGSVRIFENQGGLNYVSVFTLTGLGNVSEGFGNKLDISSSVAAINSPYKTTSYTNDGGVYTFYKDTKWNYKGFLSGGNNFDANYGLGLRVYDKSIVVGSPGNIVSFYRNAGTIDIFSYSEDIEEFYLEKTYTAINLSPNIFLGSDLDIQGSILISRSYNGINVYNLDCPPSFVPPIVVPPCTIQLLSNISSRFLKKIDASGFVLTIQCPKPEVQPLSAYCSLQTISSISVPGQSIYSINGYSILSPIFCPLTGVNYSEV